MSSQTSNIGPSKETENEPFLNYTDVSDFSSEPEQQYIPKTKRTKSIITYSLIFIITSVLWISLFTLLPLPKHTRSSKPIPTTWDSRKHNLTSTSHLLTCGTNLTTALSSNCKYDVLLNHWVPLPCYDTEFITEYLEDESWGAFADPDLKFKLESIDLLGQMEFYYTSARDHINHCGLMWKKQFFTLWEDRGVVDSILVSPGHTDHCAQFLMDVERDVTVATKVTVGYGGCWVRD